MPLKETRNFNFAKYHIIKLCQTGLDNGITHQEGFWPKNNNGSIILFLKMGWEIQSIRNNKELFMTADLLKSGTELTLCFRPTRIDKLK